MMNFLMAREIRWTATVNVKMSKTMKASKGHQIGKVIEWTVPISICPLHLVMIDLSAGARLQVVVIYSIFQL